MAPVTHPPRLTHKCLDCGAPLRPENLRCKPCYVAYNALRSHSAPVKRVEGIHIHHWLIESPHPGMLTGTCKFCKAVKQWPSSPEETGWSKTFNMTSAPAPLYVQGKNVRDR